MNEEIEQRLIKLESIISCQDQMLEDLNDVVIDQNKIISEIKTELKNLKQSLQTLSEERDDRPPPHY